MTPELEKHILEGFAGHRERLLARARAEAKGSTGRFITLPFFNMGSEDLAVYDRKEDRLTELRVVVAVPLYRERGRSGGIVFTKEEVRILLPKELPGSGSTTIQAVG